MRTQTFTAAALYDRSGAFRQRMAAPLSTHDDWRAASIDIDGASFRRDACLGATAIDGARCLVFANADAVAILATPEQPAAFAFPTQLDLEAPRTGLIAQGVADGAVIDTVRGPRPIGALAAGDVLLTAAGDKTVVKWVGRQTIFGALDPAAARPAIRIPVGALGDGFPRRDLIVTPDQAIALDGVLAHARALVGLGGIERAPAGAAGETTAFWAVETDGRDLLCVDGVALESLVAKDGHHLFDAPPLHAAMRGLPEWDAPRALSRRQLPAWLRDLLSVDAPEAALEDVGTLTPHVEEDADGRADAEAAPSATPKRVGIAA